MRKFFLSVLALMSVVCATAQTKSVELELSQAIEIALSDNPTIKIADLEISRQEYVRKESIGNLLPQLGATGGYSHPIIKNRMAGNLSFEADNTFSAGLSLTVPLFAPAVYGTLKLNDDQMRAAVESARSSRIDMVNQVSKSFYNILLAEQSLRVLFASQRTIQETVDQTLMMFNNGLTAEYDLITAQVQLSNLKPTIIQTENAITIAKRLLKMYLSLPEDVDVSLKGTLDDFKTQIMAASTDLSTDVTQNSDLRSIEIQQDILHRQYKLSKTQRMPTLGFYTNFNVVGDDFDVNAMNKIFGDPNRPIPPSAYKYRWQKPMTIGFQLSVPIFSGLKNVNKDHQIKNNISQIELQKRYLNQSLEVEVRSSISNIIAAREQMYATEKTVSQATKAYSIADTRYKAGAGTILELNSAELSLTQAKLNYSQAIYDYLSAQADYEKVIGRQ